jgi:hypothetical protein
VRALVAIAATLAVGARALADEVVVADDTVAEIAARAGVSAGELAGSVRSLESSLRSAAPAAESGGVLSTEEHDALAEAGAKKQLAGLANELDQLSAALASGADPAGEKVLLENLARRAAALSQLGAGPSRIPIPPELQAELLALWRDVQALSGRRRASIAHALAEDAQFVSEP